MTTKNTPARAEATKTKDYTCDRCHHDYAEASAGVVKQGGLGQVLERGNGKEPEGNRGISPSGSQKPGESAPPLVRVKPVWKVSYTDLEDRMYKRPFFKKTAFSEGDTKQEAIDRVKNYHGNSSRYGEFRASKAEGAKADVWFRDTPKEQPPAPQPKRTL